ncbi:hypothetical protein V5O48_010126 [Marasmius crinis-equi]|uniref:Uncharacterized protein n=1 Tax=Marasmius crinis-equi TaxID=585013 RepID=A0ABR3F955_9AGAR
MNVSQAGQSSVGDVPWTYFLADDLALDPPHTPKSSPPHDHGSPCGTISNSLSPSSACFTDDDGDSACTDMTSISTHDVAAVHENHYPLTIMAKAVRLPSTSTAFMTVSPSEEESCHPTRFLSFWRHVLAFYFPQKEGFVVQEPWQNKRIRYDWASTVLDTDTPNPTAVLIVAHTYNPHSYSGAGTCPSDGDPLVILHIRSPLNYRHPTVRTEMERNAATYFEAVTRSVRFSNAMLITAMGKAFRAKRKTTLFTEEQEKQWQYSAERTSGEAIPGIGVPAPDLRDTGWFEDVTTKDSQDCLLMIRLLDAGNPIEGGHKVSFTVIAEYQPRHAELVRAIAEVGYAPEALQAQHGTVAELQLKVEQGRTRLEKVSERTKKQKKISESSDNLKSKFSSFKLLRRSNSKGKGKDKDETSSLHTTGYLETMQEEASERERQNELEQALSEAQIEKAELEEKTKEYNALKVKLDALYDLIFNGPTTGYPEEDQLEQQVSAARAVYDRVQATLNAEKQAYECLHRAEKTLRECKAKLKDALQCAATSMFASGRSVQERETTCLQSAHMLAQQALPLVQEARQLSPGVKPLEILSIAQSIPSRTESESGDQFYAVLKSAASELAAERLTYSTRTSSARAVVEGAEQTLAQFKDELTTLRKRIFEDVAEKMQTRSATMSLNEMHDDIEEAEYLMEAPPSYQYDPPSTFVPTLSTSRLNIPNKYVQQIPAPYSDSASSPVSSSSHIWPSPITTTPTTPSGCFCVLFSFVKADV